MPVFISVSSLFVSPWFIFGCVVFVVVGWFGDVFV